MEKIRLITKADADQIAASYFKDPTFASIYVTRDGQVFNANRKGRQYLTFHETQRKLDSSWFYERSQFEEVEKKGVEKSSKELKKPQNLTKSSTKILVEYADYLVKRGELDPQDFEKMDRPDLISLLKDK